jgi:HEAT repeat protein
VNALVQALSDEQSVAYLAAQALAQIPSAEPALLRAAQSPSTRLYALMALIERNSTAAIPLLQQAARADDPALRVIAQRGLQQLAP